MKKEAKLIKKVKRLIRRIGCGRWLHHFGPKTSVLFMALIRKNVRRVIIERKCISNFENEHIIEDN